MKKFLVINPKGGCGKTTLATNLASYYALWEVPVAIIDYDSQKSALEWVDQQAEMQETLQNTLDQSGYRQYEVSAYSRPENECRHNLNYWQFGDYLGIGAGAHSKITTGHSIIRGWKHKHPETYMNHVKNRTAYKVENRVPEEEILFEFMMNALRLKNGIGTAIFQQRTGLHVDFARSSLTTAIDCGWLEITDEEIRCTTSGYTFIDEILQELLPNPG